MEAFKEYQSDNNHNNILITNEESRMQLLE